MYQKRFLRASKQQVPPLYRKGTSMKRLSLVLLLVLLAVPGFAIDIPIPSGYLPWFSVNTTLTTPSIDIRPASETLTDFLVYTFVVIGSNPGAFSPTSDPSDEYMILPSSWPKNPDGTPSQPIGYAGKVVMKSPLGPVGLRFVQGTNTTCYTAFLKSRAVYGACSKPGIPTPVIVP